MGDNYDNWQKLMKKMPWNDLKRQKNYVKRQNKSFYDRIRCYNTLNVVLRKLRFIIGEKKRSTFLQMHSPSYYNIY